MLLPNHQLIANEKDTSTQPTLQSPIGSNVPFGFDFSSFQGIFTASEISDAQAQGLAFAIGKVSEGLTLADDVFAQNRAVLEAANVPLAFYHFFRPADDPASQANFTAQLIGQLNRGNIKRVYIDAEVSGITVEMLLAYGAQIKAVLPGVETGLYTYTDFLVETLKNDPRLTALDNLWISDFTGVVPDAAKISPFTTFELYQYTGTGTFPGIVGGGKATTVDLDVWNGTLADITSIQA